MIDKAKPVEHALWLRRVYRAPVHRVFQAWIDGADLARWYTPNADWPAKVTELDVRVNGGFVAAFGAPGEIPWVERVQYLEIVPARRLVMQGLMTHDGKYVTFTRYAIDLTDLGGSTELTMLETGGDPAALDDRAGGWGGTLDNLGKLLAA